MTDKTITDYIHSNLEKNYQSQPLSERICNETLKIFNNCIYFPSLIPHFLNYLFNQSPSYCIPSGDRNQWREKNSGLFVFITGLKSHPTWAGPYLSKIQEDRPDMEVRIPHVPHNGDCSLEEASKPIASMVRDYIEKNPGKRVCLIGLSNGGRIAGRCETMLRDVDAAIRVTGIAGLYFGSKRMEDLTHLKIAPLIYSTAVMEEFKVASVVARNLIDAMRSPMPKGKEENRSYEFYATTNDWHIPNFSSCLPILGKGERHNLLTGHSHMSIAGAVCRTELERAYAWMDGNSGLVTSPYTSS